MDKDLESIFREEYSGLSRYAYRLVGDPEDGAEIVQETFLRFYRMRTQYTQAPERILLYRIARNLAIDYLRRRQTRKRHLELEGRVLVMPSVESTEQHLMAKELRQHLHEALRKLKPRDVECLTLRNEGLSYGDIALILDINPGSVGPTVTRAIKRLREAYHAVAGNSLRSAGMRASG